MIVADRPSPTVLPGHLLVVGAGYMGAQIALQAASSGWAVSVVDPDASSLARVEAKDPRIACATQLESVSAGIDLAIEAASEKLDVKRHIFAELDRLAPADALLATNSSSIRISAIEDVASHPQRLLNMHFFPPVAERPLVELMGGTHTSPQALERARDIAVSIGMTPLMVQRPSTGFLFNRVWRAIKKECLRIVDQGIGTPEDIDRAWMIIYGSGEGPFGSMDSIGLDVVLEIERVYHRESGLDADRPPQFLLDMVTEGRLGVKSGSGFYTYPEPAFRAPGFIKRPSGATLGVSVESVVGTWRLSSFDHLNARGELVVRLYGEAPRGYLTYTEDGRFHLNVMRDGRESFRGPIPEAGTADERAAAFASSLSYAGTWAVSSAPEAPVMSHRVEVSSFPNWSGVNLQRALSVSARELTLTATSGLPPGEKVVVAWERADDAVAETDRRP
jgi:3-hydroxybutyryl-CoA dehydrogenase